MPGVSDQPDVNVQTNMFYNTIGGVDFGLRNRDAWFSVRPGKSFWHLIFNVFSSRFLTPFGATLVPKNL